jgi:uncharacterized lipoprotein YbaY
MRAAFPSRAVLVLVAASALCGCGSREANPETKILGTVTSREAAAMPAGATLEIRLEDAAPPGSVGAAPQSASAAPSIASIKVDAGGQKLPISFTLVVPREALVPRHRYVLRAAIRSASGELLFTGLPDQRPIDNPNTTGKEEVAVVPASR